MHEINYKTKEIWALPPGKEIDCYDFEIRTFDVYFTRNQNIYFLPHIKFECIEEIA